MSSRPRLHVIVPARNESLNIPYFYGRAVAALEQLDLDWSLVYLNNASEDDSLQQVLNLRARDPRVKVLTLSRDFGYHSALVAGLSEVESDYYAIVDVDCEDPPELLAEFRKAIAGGAEIAYGVRSKRDEPGPLRFGRMMFYLVNNLIADSEAIMWMGEFCMMTRQVRDAVLKARTTFPFLRAELGYVGFGRAGIPYQRERRKHGQTHYNLFRMTQFAIGGILSSSTFPLRLVLYLAALLGLVFPVAVLGLRLGPLGIAALATTLGFYFGLAALSFISLYLARTYKNGVARPVFLVDRTRTHL